MDDGEEYLPAPTPCGFDRVPTIDFATYGLIGGDASAACQFRKTPEMCGDVE
jgi:hypothetical protein